MVSSPISTPVFLKFFVELDKYFDSITISSLAGAAKPSPKIFQYALDQHAMDPEEAVHIGDSVREDVEGAKQAQLTGIFLNRDQDTSLAIAPCLQNLQSLPSYLQSL